MTRAVDINAELAGLPAERSQHPHSRRRGEGRVRGAAPFRDGSIFAGRFSGETPWERHGKGDELVHVLDGAATRTIMTDEGRACSSSARGC